MAAPASAKERPKETLSLERLQPLAKRFQIMPQPDAANAFGRNEEAVLGQFVRHTHLAQSRLLQGHLHNGLFHVVLALPSMIRIATRSRLSRNLLLDVLDKGG